MRIGLRSPADHERRGDDPRDEEPAVGRHARRVALGVEAEARRPRPARPRPPAPGGRSGRDPRSSRAGGAGRWRPPPRRSDGGGAVARRAPSSGRAARPGWPGACPRWRVPGPARDATRRSRSRCGRPSSARPARRSPSPDARRGPRRRRRNPRSRTRAAAPTRSPRGHAGRAPRRGGGRRAGGPRRRTSARGPRRRGAGGRRSPRPVPTRGSGARGHRGRRAGVARSRRRRRRSRRSILHRRLRRGRIARPVALTDTRPWPLRWGHSPGPAGNRVRAHGEAPRGRDDRNARARARPSVPLYRQLYDGLRAAILSGRLSRARACRRRAPWRATWASRATPSWPRSGSSWPRATWRAASARGRIVARTLPERRSCARAARAAGARPPGPATAPVAPRRAPARDARPRSGRGAATAHRSVRACPALDAFPFELWARLVARRWRRRRRGSSSTTATRPATPPLREAIAAYLGAARGVRCDADQVIVVAGAQQALDLAARVLLDPGDAVWIEDPGYQGARGALVGGGAPARARAGRRRGLDVAAGARAARGRAARLRHAVAPVPAGRDDEPAAAAARCSTGRARAARGSSRTTTTASTATPAARWPRCRASTPTGRVIYVGHVQQGAVPGAAARLPRGAGGPRATRSSPRARSPTGTPRR